MSIHVLEKRLLWKCLNLFLTAFLETKVSCNPLDQEAKILSNHDPTTFIETAVDQSLTKHDTLYLSFNTFEGGKASVSPTTRLELCVRGKTLQRKELEKELERKF